MTAESQPPLSPQHASIFHRWFVRFNPLYFFSALCVLAGVLLISRGLDEIHSPSGRLLLAGTVQVYELLLLACAALLYRVAGQKRAAVILAVMELFFVFDWTFQTEVFASLGAVGPMLAGGWVVMGALKIFALLWIFRLRISWSAAILVLLGFAGLAFWPQLLQQAVRYNQVGAAHLLATWFGTALAGVAVLAPPRVRSRDRHDAWGQTVLRRCAGAFWVLGGVFYAVHLLGWGVQFQVGLALSHLVPLLLLSALLVRHEAVVWTGVVTALLVSLIEPATVAPTAAAATAVLAVSAWRLDARRLWTGVVLAAELAVWCLGWDGTGVPRTVLWVHVAAALVLLVMALRWKSWTAGIGCGLAALPVGQKLMPTNLLEGGIALVAVGFLALIVGVALNWDRRGPKAEPDVEVPEELSGA